MDRQQCRPEGRNCADCPGHCVRNVEELEIQKDVKALPAKLTYDRRAFGEEEFQAYLDPAGLYIGRKSRVKRSQKLQCLGTGREVERENQVIARPGKIFRSAGQD